MFNAPTIFARPRLSLITVIVIAVTFSVVRLSFPPHNIITFDYFGNYLYLPSLFIYNDIGIENLAVFDSLNAIYDNTPSFYQLSAVGDGKWVIRFYIGMAYLFSPGFFAGHLIALLTDYPADGFSLPYQRALLINGMIFTLAGLFFSRKILLRFFNDSTAALALGLMFIGSNLAFFYTFGNDAPHLYLFALYTFFIWLVIRCHDNPVVFNFVAAGAVYGLIAASRPSEIISFLIPLLWGVYNRATLTDKIRWIAKHYRKILAGVLVFVLPLIPQFLYWKYVTGSFFFNPYDDPASTLQLADPQFIDTLFGFRKGLFIYSPMILLGYAGMFLLFRRLPGIALPVTLYVSLNTYLIASFTSLISFGWRAFIQSYAMLLLPMGYIAQLILRSRLYVRIPVFIVLLALAAFNNFKSWQISSRVIDGSRMTREYYFAVFLKQWASPENRKLLLVERPTTPYEILHDAAHYRHDTLAFFNFEHPVAGQEFYFDTLNVFEGEYSFMLDSTMAFAASFVTSFNRLTDKYHAWLRVTAYIYVPCEEQMNQVHLVAQTENRGDIYKYRAMNLGHERFGARAGQWNKIQLDYLTPEVLSKYDKIRTYIWYSGCYPVFIDNVLIERFH